MRDYAKTGGRPGRPAYRIPSSFRSKVLNVVRAIPKGKTMSYRDVAIAAGSPNAQRAVGTIMKNNCDKNVPCHRVVKSNGEPGKYNGLRGNKSKLLRSEGALTREKQYGH